MNNALGVPGQRNKGQHSMMIQTTDNLADAIADTDHGTTLELEEGIHSMRACSIEDQSLSIVGLGRGAIIVPEFGEVGSDWAHVHDILWRRLPPPANSGFYLADETHLSLTNIAMMRFVGGMDGLIPKGGAIALKGTSSLHAERCTFGSNWAMQGGAIHVSGDSTATFDRCDFIANRAETVTSGMSVGGAIATALARSVQMERCKFRSNYSASMGGAIGLQAAIDGVMGSQCLFERNEARAFGGAIWSQETQATLERCTIGNNDARYGRSIAVQGQNGAISLIDTYAPDPALEYGGGSVIGDGSGSGSGDFDAGVGIPDEETGGVTAPGARLWLGLNPADGLDEYTGLSAERDQTGGTSAQSMRAVEELTSHGYFLAAPDDMDGEPIRDTLLRGVYGSASSASAMAENISRVFGREFEIGSAEIVY